VNKIENLKKRSEILRRIRSFFYERSVLEVETPILSKYASVDLNIDSFSCSYELERKKEATLYLQTSPEFHMKQLLAEGIGPIYQISKAFRNGEYSNLHNPEFTILEWYRIGYSIFDLMDEIELLLNDLGQTLKIERLSYRELFRNLLELDPFNITVTELEIICKTHSEHTDFTKFSKMEMLDFLISHVIENKLKKEKKHCFVYDYPKEAAALAKLNDDNFTAARFELYLSGIEICNGFNELSNPKEQEERFKYENSQREKQLKAKLPYSKPLIKALEKGLPESSGVAFGLDRLIAFLLSEDRIEKVMSYTITNA
jgi:elongation factor P--(R)-beta-lysine ligase